MDNIVSLVVAVLGGGGIGFYFNYLISNRKTDQDEFKLLLETWREDNERLRQRELSNSEEIKRLGSELSNLKNKLVMLESAHFDLPLPQWLKDLDGTMLSVNAEYESVFLAPHDVRATDYIGAKDDAIWGEETAKHFKITDTKVYRTKKPFHAVERIPDGNGGHIEYEIFKYPRFSGNIMIGIGGIALKEKVVYESQQ
jgi:hypothetical protein